MGVGSIFSFQLPLARCDKPDDHALTAVTAPVPPFIYAQNVDGDQTEAISILVAEDNPTNQFVLKTLFEGLGISQLSLPMGKRRLRLGRRPILMWC
ncbi:MAG: hypothetical protein HC777_02580 [Hyphomonadaceae bacterium]|nr:hypothetical protein [Hyphomonadaceae bacterium]